MHFYKLHQDEVYFLSVTGLRAFPGVVAYNMSKAALDMLTRNKRELLRNMFLDTEMEKRADGADASVLIFFPVLC